METYHIPVLLQETISYLNVKPGEKYIDCTLGGGGHTAGILAAGGIVLGIDQDLEAINYCRENSKFEIRNSKLSLRQGNFAHLKEIADTIPFRGISGILFDLGVSSHQLETPSRGFSFARSHLARLDMRMDPENQAVTAADLLNAGSEAELANLFWKFGEERDSRKIAKAIVENRERGKIETTDELVKIILSVSRKGKSDRTHPATRVFQALRLAVNDELTSLEEALPESLDVLANGGRLVIISFHSLEDRIVKNFMKNHQDKLKIITQKPITPSESEVLTNPRSRSAKLRVAEKNI